MVSYTTLEYYTDEYLQGRKAVISAADFSLYAQKSTQEIKRYTCDNVDETSDLPDELQSCCCDLAEYLYLQDNKDHDEDVQSEKKGEWSTTYVSAKEANDLKKNRIRDIVYTWLSNTGLLFRGC